MFDVVFFDDDARARETRNCLYEYLAVKLVKDQIEFIGKSSCNDINKNSRISELRKRLSEIRTFPEMDTQMIDGDIAELSGFITQTETAVVNCIRKADKERFSETFLPHVVSVFTCVEDRAKGVVGQSILVN